MATQLIITPDFDKKNAKLVGSVAVGEKISLLVIGVDAADLRVRIRFADKEMARFPLNAGDAWETSGDNVMGLMELNTVELRNVFEALDDFARLPCTLIVENNGDTDNLYAVSSIQIRNWIPIAGDQVPVSVGEWKDDLADAISAMGDMQVDISALQGFQTHIHDGVSGVSFDHGHLIGSGDNTHAEIDTKLNTLHDAWNNHYGEVTAHVLAKDNPHEVTKDQINGLDNVQNTADIDKVVSSLTQIELDKKATIVALNAHLNTVTGNPHKVARADILDLENVDNTSDATKPVSQPVRDAIDFHANNTNDPHGTLTAWRNAFNLIDMPTDIDGLFTAWYKLLTALKG